MANTIGDAVPVNGRFRPESVSHFKEVAKNMAWLLERPVQGCQEALAKIYGYSGLHELQQVLKKPGVPGPFDSRYAHTVCNTDTLTACRHQRIFFILFGLPHGYWRERRNGEDKYLLVYELGLFQEAAEHRNCFNKIRKVLTSAVFPVEWPLIQGWPLGLKSWLVGYYTEPVKLAEGWSNVLPRAKRFPPGAADIVWQRQMTGAVRLATLFRILAPRVSGPALLEQAAIPIDEFEDDSSIVGDIHWERQYLVEWLTAKLALGSSDLAEQVELIQAFVDRPSRKTAAACEFLKDLENPVDFRDRWAFDCFGATLADPADPSKAFFQSTFADNAIQSTFLWQDRSSAQIGGGQFRLWMFNNTWNEVLDSPHPAERPTMQPVIHAQGALIVPFDGNFIVMSEADWYLSHDDSAFASEASAHAFATIYLPEIGVDSLDFAYRKSPYSILEIDELLLASAVTDEILRAYFVRMLGVFEDDGFPDSDGYWCETLSLTYGDDEENEHRNTNGEYAEYVYRPAVMLIDIAGGGLTFVAARHRDGSRASVLKERLGKNSLAESRALAVRLVEAVKGLNVDVVIYDSLL